MRVIPRVSRRCSPPLASATNLLFSRPKPDVFVTLAAEARHLRDIRGHTGSAEQDDDPGIIHGQHQIPRTPASDRGRDRTPP